MTRFGVFFLTGMLLITAFMPLMQGDAFLLESNDDSIQAGPDSKGVEAKTFSERDAAFEGNGTPEDPYLIYDAWDLQNMTNNLTAHYALANDVNASITFDWNAEQGFTPVGNSSSRFQGSFDGRNYIITGLYINRSSTDYVGLFGYATSSSQIINVGMENAMVMGNWYVGPLVGWTEGTVNASYSSLPKVYGYAQTGGLIGLNYHGNVSDCRSEDVDVYSFREGGGLMGSNGGLLEDSHSSGEVNGSQRAGGLVGQSVGYIINSYSHADVMVENNDAGGLVGFLGDSENEGTVFNCHATGEVSAGTINAGGLIAFNQGGHVNASYATGNVSGTESVGGLVGYSKAGINNDGLIENAYSDGNVEGTTRVGGLVGFMETTSIADSHSKADVTGHGDKVGGFAGESSGQMEKCFAHGNVLNTETSTTWGYTGGFIGLMTGGSIVESYSSGDVAGADRLGGFAGQLDSGTTVERCYASGNVDAGGYIGGFAGVNYPDLYDCYATGHVQGTDNSVIGGFIGESYGALHNCYSTGRVSVSGSSSTIGGLVGRDNGATYMNCFYDNQTSGQTTSDGGTGKNLTDMMTNTTFMDSGWDFNTTWWMVSGQTRPFLQMEWSSEILADHQVQLMEMNFTTDYTLECDIDMSGTTNPSSMWGTNLSSGKGFYSVANYFHSSHSSKFTGTFDGKGSTIESLYINRSDEDYVGLFGSISTGGTVRNVNFVNGTIAGRDAVGGLVGIFDDGKVENVSINANVLGNIYTGVLAGLNYALMTNSSASGHIENSDYLGGIAGTNGNGAVIENSISDVTVAGSQRIGGIAGTNDGIISNCQATISGSGYSYIGGIAGSNTDTISDSHAMVNITATAQNSYMGGIAGSSSGTISGTEASGTITGPNYVGGVAGNSDVGATVMDSSASARVEGDYFVGGLVGNNHGTISNGSTDGSDLVVGHNYHTGGLVGWNEGTINQSHSSKNVDGNSNVGGLVGYNTNGGIVENSYATGSVHGTSMRVGGLVGNQIGSNYDSSVIDCFATGDVNGTDIHVGGLVGSNSYGSIIRSHATGNVTGVDQIGGLVGYNRGPVTECHSDNMVTGEDSVGGLVGQNYQGYVYNSTSKSNVQGIYYVGGLVGTDKQDSMVENSYATGTASGESHVGGICGSHESGSIIKECYAMVNLTGNSYVGGIAGSDNIASVENSFYHETMPECEYYNQGSLPLSDAEFGSIGTFDYAGWDISMTNTTRQYPFLSWEEGGSGSAWLIQTSPNVTYNLTILVEGNGTTDPAAGTYEVYENTKLTLNALPAQYHYFENWTGEVNSQNNQTTITVDGNMTVTANFKPVSSQIHTWKDLHNIRYYITGNFTLMNDLNETSPGYEEYVNTTNGWEPIGDYSYSYDEEFSGHFHGQGHEISGLYIFRNEDYVGLFGSITGTVENVHLVDANITGTSFATGILAGNNQGVISNVSVDGYVRGYDGTGGLLGENYGYVNYSYSSGTVEATSWGTGGLVGYMWEGRISQSFSTSNVTGNESIGGLVGDNTFGWIDNSYARGSVNGYLNVGGLVGLNGWQGSWGDYPGYIDDSYSTGLVEGQFSVGGLVGFLDVGSANNSFWDNQTSGLDSSDGGTGLNTSKMMAQTTFTDAGWNFESVWWMIDGETYPRLIWGLDAPSAPKNLQAIPDNGLVNITWTPPMDEMDSLISQYIIYRGTASGDLSTLNVVDADTTSYADTGLDDDLTYFYRIGAVNPAGEGALSNEVNATPLSIFSGEGTLENPYLIHNVWELQAMTTDLTANYALANDIDALPAVSWNNGAGFVPVGYDNSESFAGGFDGRNHTINGLFIDRSDADNVGLFGYAGPESIVKNVGLKDVTIMGNNDVGGLVGNNVGTIENAFSTGNVTGSARVGGLVGENTGTTATIARSYSRADVTGTMMNAGGLVGSNGWDAVVVNSYATGSVAGDFYVGGLVGTNRDGAIINTSYSAGHVTGTSSAGGLVGINDSAYEYASFWDNQTSGMSQSQGGTGLNTTQMKTQYTFTNASWDFEGTWWMVENVTYPRFIWQVAMVEIETAGGTEIEAGDILNFTAKAYDGDGYLMTDDATDFIWENADMNGVFNETVTGEYDVMATFNGVSSSPIVVTVVPGDVETIEIEPSLNQITGIGISIDFNATASDAYGNVITDDDADFIWENASADGLFNQTELGDYAVAAFFGNETSFTVTVSVIDNVAPTADAGPDRVAQVNGTFTFNGSGSTDNIGIDNYTWTFVDVAEQTLHGVSPSFVFTQAGTYLVTLNVTDEEGNWDADSMRVFVGDYTFTETLSHGWNLISIPTNETDYSIEGIFHSLEGKFDQVQTYDSLNKEWLFYGTDRPAFLNTLNILSPGMGIWIHITEVDGAQWALEGTPHDSPVAIELTEGWNLIGYPTLAEGQTINDVFAGISWDMIQMCNQSQEYNLVYLPGWYEMEPGRGYWVHVTMDCVLTV